MKFKNKNHQAIFSSESQKLNRNDKPDRCLGLKKQAKWSKNARKIFTTD